MHPLTRKLDAFQREYEHAMRCVDEESAALKKTKRVLGDALRAREVAQEVAARVQESAHRQVASIVTKALAEVFGEDAYEFCIKFDQKRGKTEARLVFMRDGQEYQPLISSSGGAVHVAGFALRLAKLVLERPVKRKLMLLDEPFRGVSRRYVARVARMLETLSEELDVQFILVTHDPRLRVGDVIEL